MSEQELIAIADGANMIVRGYAFTRKGDFISVLNLNRPTSAVVIDNNGKIVESCMDPIEQAIVQRIWKNDSEFMEVADA